MSLSNYSNHLHRHYDWPVHARRLSRSHTLRNFSRAALCILWVHCSWRFCHADHFHYVVILVGVSADFHTLSCYPRRRSFASPASRVAYSVCRVFSSTDSSVATLIHTQLSSAIFLRFCIPSGPSRGWRLRHESSRCVTGAYVVQTGGSGHVRHLSAVLLVCTLACIILMTSTQFQRCPRSLLTRLNHLHQYLIGDKFGRLAMLHVDAMEAPSLTLVSLGDICLLYILTTISDGYHNRLPRQPL